MKALAIAIGAILVAGQVLAATAIFTGQQRQVRTVTGMMAWECEYMYAGQKFWKIFQNSCPPSIEVQ